VRPPDARLIRLTLNDGHQRLFQRAARLKEARKVRPLPQLRHAQVQRHHPGLELTVAIAVAIGLAALAALNAAVADHALDVMLQQRLRRRLGHRAQEITLDRMARPCFCSRAIKGMLVSVIGAPFGPSLKSANSTMNRRPRWPARRHRSKGAKVHHVCGRYRGKIEDHGE
jgi:hypothetical protein